MTREDFVNLRHELRTSLNHVMGYSEILQEDTKEFERTEFLDEYRRINELGRELRELISYYFDPEKCDIAELESEQIKQELYSRIYEIIGMIQQIRKTYETQEAGYFLSDIDKILTAANRMLDLIDHRLADMFFDLKISRPGEEEEPITARLDSAAGDLLPLEGKLRSIGTILVVDDNDMNRDMLSRHLERQGHRVLTTGDGYEALRLLDDQPVDVIILDIMMPGLNGYQVLKQVKTNPRLKFIPVIMISALDEMESVVRCIEMGAEDYLPKSFDPVLLKARIDASLEKKRFRDQEQLYLDTIIESQRILAGELSDAADYVKNLLPPPLVGDVKTDWLFIPSAQLGGDSFGYHWLDDNHLAMYVLDVSGHGIGAALLSVSVMNILRTQALPGTDFYNPGHVLTALNRSFQMDEQNNMFFSIWYGVFRKDERTIRYASAGSPPGVLITFGPNGEKSVAQLSTPDMIIGLEEELHYHTAITPVPPGSKLYLFSDGAYEVRRTNGKMMELSDFIKVLSMQPNHGTPTVQAILNQIQGLAMSDAFEDDFSLLEIRFP